MTLYKLPDWLGGHKCQALNENGQGILVEIDQYEGQRIIVPRDLLTEVKPPLPPEPPAGSVVLDKDGDVWQRDNEASEYGWAGAAVPNRVPWSRLHEQYGPLRRLVPDPADDPALVERVAQAMRDANRPEAWIHQQIVPFDHFAKVAVDTILRAAREVEQP